MSPPLPPPSIRAGAAAAEPKMESRQPELTRDALPAWVRDVLGQLPSGAEMGGARLRHRLVDYAAIVTNDKQPWAAMHKRHARYNPPRNNPHVLWRWPPPPVPVGGADEPPSFSDSEGDDSDAGGLPSLPAGTGQAERELSGTSASSHSSAAHDGGAVLSVQGDHADLPFPDMLHWWVFGDAGRNTRTQSGCVFSFPLHTGTPHEDTVLWGVAIELPMPPAAVLRESGSTLHNSPRLRFVLLTRSQHVSELTIMLQDALQCDTQHVAAGGSPCWVVPRIAPSPAALKSGESAHRHTLRPKLSLHHHNYGSFDGLHSMPAPGGMAGHVPEAFATTDAGQLMAAGQSTPSSMRLRAPVMATGVNSLSVSRTGMVEDSPNGSSVQVKANASGRVMYVTQASAPSSPKGTRERRSSSVSRSAFAGAAASAAGHERDHSLDGGEGLFQTPRFGNAPLYVPWADSDSSTMEHKGLSSHESGDHGLHSLCGPLQFDPPVNAEHWMRWLALGVPLPTAAAKVRTAVPLPSAIERYWTASMAAIDSEPVQLPVAHGCDMVSLQPALLGEFPANPLTLQPLARALSAKVILQGMECLLRERHVLVVGACAQEVSAVTHGLAAMVYPLRWSLPHVPLLPKNILEQGDHLESPVPFLYGVTSQALRACMQPVSAPDTAASRRRSARDVQLARMCDSPGAVSFMMGLSASAVMGVAGVSCSEMFAEMACPGRVSRKRRTTTGGSPTARDKRYQAASVAIKELNSMIDAHHGSDDGGSVDDMDPEAHRRRAESGGGALPAVRADSADTFAHSSAWSGMDQTSASVCHAHVLDLEHGCFVRGGLRGWALQLAADQKWMPRPPHECECQLSSRVPATSEDARAAVRGVGRQNPLPVGFRGPTQSASASGGSTPKREGSTDSAEAFGIFASETLESPTRRRMSMHTRLGDGTQPVQPSGDGFSTEPGSSTSAAAASRAPGDTARKMPRVATEWEVCFPKPLAEGFQHDVQHLLRAARLGDSEHSAFPWGPQHDQALQRLALRLMWHTLLGVNDAAWVPGGASVAAARFAQTKRAELEWAQSTEHPAVASLPYISRSKLADTALFLHRIAASQAMARFLELHSGTHSRTAWVQLLQLACGNTSGDKALASMSPPLTPAASKLTRLRRLSVELPGEEQVRGSPTPPHIQLFESRSSPELRLVPPSDTLWSPVPASVHNSYEGTAESSAQSPTDESSFVVRGFSPQPRPRIDTFPSRSALSFDVGGWLTQVARIAGDVPRPSPAMVLSFSHWFVQLMHDKASVRRSAQTAKLSPPSPSRRPGAGDRPRAHLVPSCDWEASAAYLPALSGGIDLGAVGGDSSTAGAFRLRIEPPAYTAYVLPPLPHEVVAALQGTSASDSPSQAWGEHLHEAFDDHEQCVRMEGLELAVQCPIQPARGTFVATLRALGRSTVWDNAILSGLCTAGQLVAALANQTPHLAVQLLRCVPLKGRPYTSCSMPSYFARDIGAFRSEVLLNQAVPVAAAEGAIAEQLLRAAVYASVAGADLTPTYTIHSLRTDPDGMVEAGSGGAQVGTLRSDSALLAITADSLLDSTSDVNDDRSGHDELVLTALSAPVSCPMGLATVAQVLPSPWEVEQPLLVTVAGGDFLGNSPLVTPCPAALAASSRVHATDMALPVLAMSRHLVARQPAVRTLVSLLSAACAPSRAALRQQMAVDHGALPLRDTMRVLHVHAAGDAAVGDAGTAAADERLAQAHVSAAVRLRLKAQAARIRASTHVEGQGTDDELPEIHPQTQAVSAGDPMGSRAAPLGSDLADAAMRAIDSFQSPQGRSAFVQMLQQHVLLLRGYSRPAACGAIPGSALLGTGAAPIAPDPSIAGLASPQLQSPEWGSAPTWITRHPTAHLLPELGPGVFGSSAARGISHSSVKLWPPSAAALAVVARVLLSLSAADGDYDTAAALLQVSRHFSTPLDGLWVAAAASQARAMQKQGLATAAGAAPRVDDPMMGIDSTASFAQLQESAKVCLAHAPWPVLLTHCCPTWNTSPGSAPQPTPLTSILLSGGPRPGQGLTLQTALIGEASPATSAPQFWDTVMRSVFAEQMRGASAGGKIETPPPGDALDVKSETLSSLFLEQLHAMVVAGAPRSVLAAWVAVLPLHEAQVISLEAALTQVTTAHAAQLQELVHGDAHFKDEAVSMWGSDSTAGGNVRTGARPRAATAAPEMVGGGWRAARRGGAAAAPGRGGGGGGGGDKYEHTPDSSPGADHGGSGSSPERVLSLGRADVDTTSPRGRRRASSAAARRIARELLLPGADVTVAHTAISLHVPMANQNTEVVPRGAVRAVDSSVPAFSGVTEGTPEASPTLTAARSPLTPLSVGSPVGGLSLPATPATRDPLQRPPTSPWAASDAVAWWTHLQQETAATALPFGELTDRLQWLPLRSVMGALAMLRKAEEGGGSTEEGGRGGAMLVPAPTLLRGFGAQRRLSTDSHPSAAEAPKGGPGGSLGGQPQSATPDCVLVDTPWRAQAPPLSPLDLQLLCHSVTLADSGTAVTVLARSSGGAAQLPSSREMLPPTRRISHTREVLLAGSSTGACVLWDVTRNKAVGAPWRPHAGSVTGAVILTLASPDQHDPLSPPSAYAVVTAGQGGNVCVSLHSAGNTEHSLFLGMRSSADGTIQQGSRGVPPVLAAPRDAFTGFGERFATGVTYLPCDPGEEQEHNRRGSIGSRLKRMFKSKKASEAAPAAGKVATSCLTASWLNTAGGDSGSDSVTPPPPPHKPTLQVAAGYADGSIALWRVSLRTSTQSSNSTPAVSPERAAAAASGGFVPDSAAKTSPSRWGRKAVTASGVGGACLGWNATASAVIVCEGGHDKASPPQGVAVLSLARGTAPLVLSWGRDGTVCIWCAQTGSLLNAWRAHTRAVIAARVMQNPYTGGAVLATGSLDGFVHLWSLSSVATSTVDKPRSHAGSQLPCMAGAVVNSVSVQHSATLNCQSPVWSLAMSYSSLCGRLVVVAGADSGCVFAWAFRALTPSASILSSWAVRRAHTAAVTALDLHSSVGLVASGSEDASVMLVDVGRLLGEGNDAPDSGSLVTWEAPAVLPEDGGAARHGYVACPVEAVWSTHDMEGESEGEDGNDIGGDGAPAMLRSSSQRSTRALQGCKACHMSQVAAVQLLPGAVASVSWDGTLRVWHALSSAVRDAATTHQAERAAMLANMQ